VKRLVVFTVGALLVIGALAACGGTGAGAQKAAVTKPAKPSHQITDIDGWDCQNTETKFARCPNNPYFGKTVAQIRAAKRAKARAAAAEAAEARRQAVEAQKQAAAHAAYVRAVNAWHAGYNRADGCDEFGTCTSGVYARFLDSSSFSCEEYIAEYGCWKVRVITRDGCQSYVGVEANEYSGGSIINGLLDNNGTGIPPKTPITFELDASQANTTVGDLKVQCS
jgi:hypothetical protein